MDTNISIIGNSGNSENIPSYCDDEIEGHVSKKSFTDAFASLDAFEFTKSGYRFRKIETNCGKEMALQKYWKNKTYRLELWFTNEGYAALFGSTLFGSLDEKDDFLMVSCYNGHPNIICKEFEFANSDGSTDVDVNISDISFHDLKELMKKNAIEFTLNQVH